MEKEIIFPDAYLYQAHFTSDTPEKKRERE